MPLAMMKPTWPQRPAMGGHWMVLPSNCVLPDEWAPVSEACTGAASAAVVARRAMSTAMILPRGLSTCETSVSLQEDFGGDGLSGFEPMPGLCNPQAVSCGCRTLIREGVDEALELLGGPAFEHSVA